MMFWIWLSCAPAPVPALPPIYHDVSNPTELAGVVAALDKNGNGTVERDEYLRAAGNPDHDLDNDGILSTKELTWAWMSTDPLHFDPQLEVKSQRIDPPPVPRGPNTRPSPSSPLPAPHSPPDPDAEALLFLRAEILAQSPDADVPSVADTRTMPTPLHVRAQLRTAADAHGLSDIASHPLLSADRDAASPSP